MIPAVGSSWIFWRRKQSKLVKQRKDLFQKNGGYILKRMQGRCGRLSFFTAEELKRATKNYDENNIIRRDYRSEGIEYKGELSIEGVHQSVAIMKCLEIDESKIEAYISKLVTTSLVHHKNVVKLIGCCLETRVPLLVYEFIAVKTLYDYIHNQDCSAALLTWDIRLKIAVGSARALAYMHSSANIPIIHGNLNSSNILIQLPDTPKVQGFALEDCCYSNYMLCYTGKLEYMDPEYLYSGTFTEKSDVYSFGVILAELLTGKNVIERPGGQHLAQYFVSSSTRDEWIQILDRRMAIEGSVEQLIQVAKIAQRCLSVLPVERPTMEEVTMELQSVVGTSSSSTITRPNSRLQTTVRRLLRRNKSL